MQCQLIILASWLPASYFFFTNNSISKFIHNLCYTFYSSISSRQPHSTMPPKRNPIAISGQQDVQAHLLSTPSSHTQNNARTSSKSKKANVSTPKKTRRDSMFTPSPDSQASSNKGTTSPSKGKNVRFVMPESEINQPSPSSSPSKPTPSMAANPFFDDLCLDIARAPAILQILHSPNSKPSSPLSTASVRNILAPLGRIYRSLSLSDPRLTGHPIRYRSTHFSLSPRGLRVGDCEFLNLPPGEGVNLTTRAGVDGRPVFVLEFVAAMYDVEHGGVVWIAASQVEVTEWVRGVAVAVIRAREGRERARLDVEERRLKRVKEQLLVYPNTVAALDDAKYFSSDTDCEDLEVSDGVRSAKGSKKVRKTPEQQRTRHFDESTNSTLSTPADTKYFSSCSDDESETMFDDDHFFTSPSSASSSSPMRNSLTSHPNTAFLYHSPSHAANLNAAFTASKQKETRQVSTPAATITTANNKEEEDIWRSLSHAYARPDFYANRSSTNLKPLPKPVSNHTIPNHAHDTIPLPSLLYLHQLISTLRSLHRDSFVLKYTATTISDSTNNGDDNEYTITHTSSSLRRTPKDVQAAFGTSHAQTKQMLVAGLQTGGEMKMRVRWGVKGEERWVYFVPLVQGGRGSVGEERCWMGFLVGGEGGAGVWAGE